jgi:hypothetical protein
MKLSSIDSGINHKRYAVVYHTHHDSDIVEFVRLKFFKSEKAAFKWFNRKFKYNDFILPEIVKVHGFNNLKLSSVPEAGIGSEYQSAL